MAQRGSSPTNITTDMALSSVSFGATAFTLTTHAMVVYSDTRSEAYTLRALDTALRAWWRDYMRSDASSFP